MKAKRLLVLNGVMYVTPTNGPTNGELFFFHPEKKWPETSLGARSCSYTDMIQNFDEGSKNDPFWGISNLMF